MTTCAPCAAAAGMESRNFVRYSPGEYVTVIIAMGATGGTLPQSRAQSVLPRWQRGKPGRLPAARVQVHPDRAARRGGVLRGGDSAHAGRVVAGGLEDRGGEARPARNLPTAGGVQQSRQLGRGRLSLVPSRRRRAGLRMLPL